MLFIISSLFLHNVIPTPFNTSQSPPIRTQNSNPIPQRSHPPIRTQTSCPMGPLCCILQAKNTVSTSDDGKREAKSVQHMARILQPIRSMLSRNPGWSVTTSKRMLDVLLHHLYYRVWQPVDVCRPAAPLLFKPFSCSQIRLVFLQDGDVLSSPVRAKADAELKKYKWQKGEK